MKRCIWSDPELKNLTKVEEYPEENSSENYVELWADGIKYAVLYTGEDGTHKEPHRTNCKCCGAPLRYFTCEYCGGEKFMTKEELFGYLGDVNEKYNDPNMSIKLSYMLDRLIIEHDEKETKENKYKVMAKTIQNKILEDINGTTGYISISKEDALMIYTTLIGMSNILQITRSEYGGSELFG